MRENIAWIVVADGASARIFENAGRGSGISEIWSHASEDARTPTRDLGSDRPGRDQGAPGIARHGFATHADWHEAAKKDFIAALAHKLNEAAVVGEFGKLVLVAAPKALGQLREALEGIAAIFIVAEIDKDLTHLSIHELPERISEVFPL